MVRLVGGALAGLLFLALPVSDLHASGAGKKDPTPATPPVRATLQPNLTIPAEPLGFSAPGEFYLGMRNALVSLDFLDENRILFTFRVPGLLHRANGSNDDSEGQRQIRAVVLRLPQGAVESETVWTVHDRARYLYMLDGGRFLFRDGNELRIGDASLELKPFLRFPGAVERVEIDPSRKYLVTNSVEPLEKKAAAGEVGSPATAAATVTSDDKGGGERDMILRILRRSSGDVMLVSRINSAVHLPINDDGYLEPLRGRGAEWTLSLNHFSGGSTVVGSVDSVCAPQLDFISEEEFLATACDRSGDPGLVAMGMNGKHLWHLPAVGPAVWPMLIVSAGGTRLARESLMTDHAVNAMSPLGSEDIRGQDVQVIDAATGKVVLRAAASPILDAGGNVAISPSGRRVAILMDGKLQIFDLPAAPDASSQFGVHSSQ